MYYSIMIWYLYTMQNDTPIGLVNICHLNIVTEEFFLLWWELLTLLSSVQFSSVAQSCPTLHDPGTAARQASLSITNSWSLPKLMYIELVMPSNHLILCRLLLLPPSIFPSIRVSSNESVLHIRWSTLLATFKYAVYFITESLYLLTLFIHFYDSPW